MTKDDISADAPDLWREKKAQWLDGIYAPCAAIVHNPALPCDVEPNSAYFHGVRPEEPAEAPDALLADAVRSAKAEPEAALGEPQWQIEERERKRLAKLFREKGLML